MINDYHELCNLVFTFQSVVPDHLAAEIEGGLDRWIPSCSTDGTNQTLGKWPQDFTCITPHFIPSKLIVSFTVF